MDSFLVANTWQSHKLKLEYKGNAYIIEGKDYHNYFFPENDIAIPDGYKTFLGTNVVRMWFQGVEFRDTKLEPFIISKNEVSNKDFQQFVEEGGYENPKYWDFPFMVGDKILDFKESLTVILISVLFIILASNLKFEQLPKFDDWRLFSVVDADPLKRRLKKQKH